MAYPQITIRTQKIRKNASALLQLCRSKGVEPVAVIKGHGAHPEITDATVEAGFKTLASSRIPHMVFAQQRYALPTMLLRLPMLSEIKEVVRYCDISLNSEQRTLELLNQEAREQNRKHKVLLMRDLGDLREGIISAERCAELACYIESKLPYLHLYGIGVNLGCYGSVLPTADNLSQLAENARQIESAIGRKLEAVSGGAGSSVPLLLNDQMPEGVNQLRIGASILIRSDILNLPESALPDLCDDTLVLEAEIIEIGAKPTRPTGVLGKDCFGNVKEYPDRGVRRRALLAIGAFDVGNSDKLVPLDPDVTVLGGSSDHTIVDIHDSSETYALGGTMRFVLEYQALLSGMHNPLVEKIVIEKEA